jgi:hypothetical protein
MRDITSASDEAHTSRLHGCVILQQSHTKCQPMKKKIDSPEMPVASDSLPRVSLILPFEEKMNTVAGLFNLLTSAADKIEKELMVTYPKERVMPVIKKLRGLINGVHCRGSKSVGIFVSPVMGKVYYFTATPEKSNYPPSITLINKTNQN